MKNKQKKDYIALLTITEMPKTKEGEERLVNWLRKTAQEIKQENPHNFATPCRFRLMK
jgi:hypothetical protein